MIQDHADAVLGLLRDAIDALPPMRVYPLADGSVPSGLRPPYVRVYISVARPDGTDISGTSDRAVCTAYLHQIGGDDVAARAVADACAVALLDVTPTVTGRVCWPIRHDAGQPPQREEATGPTVIDQVDVYSFASLPSD